MSRKNKKPRRPSEAYENSASRNAESSYPHSTRNSTKIQDAHRILAPIIRNASRQGHTEIEDAMVGLYLTWASLDEEIDYADDYE